MKTTYNKCYAKFSKGFLDFLISFLFTLLLSPLLIILTVSGAIIMRGNPFFVQERPGLHGKSFFLIKFRTMTNKKDKNGKLLPDKERLNKYGLFLRKTSLDELGELLNILKGEMSFVGPRPLLMEYLPYYNEEEQHRHDVRPGLTGWAQVNGRNSVSWDKRFAYDVEYSQKVCFRFDIYILLKTVSIVFKRSEVAEDTNAIEGNFANIRKLETQKEMIKK